MAKGALEEVVGVSEEEESPAGALYESQDEIVSSAKMAPSAAKKRLQEARQRLLDSRKTDESARHFARARAYLAPTRTGRFGESLGRVAGAEADFRTAEQKRISDIDKELLQTEVDLERIQQGYGRAGASQREFETLIAGFSEEDKERARRIKTGLDARAVGSADITASGLPKELQDALLEYVGEKAETKKFSELTGKSRAEAIDTGFESVQGIDANIRNIDAAIQAVDDGADVGYIENFFPSIRESTIRLKNLQGKLGLDVVGAVTFGSLSQGELNLALMTAMPDDLQEADLRQWLVDRKAAQQKLREYFQRQIDFLDNDGTVAGFLRVEKRAAGTPQPQPSGLETLSDEELEAQIQAAQGAGGP